jgi:hypothetical protein
MTSLGETLGILSWGGCFNRNLASTGKTCRSSAHILTVIIFEIFVFHARRSIVDFRALGQGDGRMTYIPWLIEIQDFVQTSQTHAVLRPMDI